MSLLEQVQHDMKNALRNKENLKLSCLRMTYNALKLKEKENLRSSSELEEIQTLKSLIKQRRDAAEQFAKAARQDLADKELAEAAIIEAYLPAQLDDQALNRVLDDIFAEMKPASLKDMGAVMKEAMARLAGQADGKLVNQLIKQRLEQN